MYHGHNTLNQLWFNVGPLSTKMAQHQCGIFAWFMFINDIGHTNKHTVNSRRVDRSTIVQ